ncbi:polysaccharide biosynthesis protein [Aliidiomarina minuta]|uniref:Polysaccharide biosynthesis protein n=2 Tax=Aliidiomarina minuta TaxID=880057 RepID=A0A432WAP4_9GAMM|nr:polysaccharide biosynthesis protein [Aliidiomarina minuta]
MPSQAQIEQLRSLPRAQQEQLARQFGVDIDMLDQMDRQDSQAEQREQQERDLVFPRGTRFDHTGEPIIPEDLERQFTRDDEVIRPFGYDMFAAQPSTFAPTSHAPVPSNYIMGVGDSIKVQLFGQEDTVHNLIIDREGKVVIPRLGEMNVAGLTYSAMQELIQHRVRERLIGFQVAVSMGELRSIQIFIVGEAYQPGAYTVSSLSTISQALYVAGGVSDIASLRSVRLMRGGNVESEFDLYDLLMRGDASADRILQSGDVVFIPPRGDMITVKGEVNRPAMYELKGGETLEDALKLAGGAKAEAYLPSTQVRRVRDGRRQMTTLDLSSQDHLQRSVQGGDEIVLREVSEGLDNSLLVVGAVSRPGQYEWQEGLRINDILRSSRHDLLEQADLSYGLVVREHGPRRELRVYQFDVALAIDGDRGENLELNERDQLVIFSRYQTKAEEQEKLSRLTRSKQEREQEERQELLADYRRAFLRDLVREKENSDREAREERERAERLTPLRELFGTPDQDEGRVADEDLAEYSRENLLDPIMQRLQRQRTESGNTPFVYVAGEVNHPGVYPLVQNASASRLISAAGGLKDSAYLQRAEVTRINLKGGQAETEYMPFDLLDVILGNEDIALQGRDRLNVLSIPEWQNTYEVTLRGEVRFPGTYAIRRGESLSALVERAGGFTDFAFLDGAVFTRDELREQERRRMTMLAEELQREIASNAITGTGGSNQSYEQMRTLLADLMAVEPVGRLIIDLPRILAGESQAGDITLKDGDTLHVPSRQDSISILGEVQMATSYRFDRDLTVTDYINMSGGTKQKADERRIYVVKANGAIEPHRQRRGWFSHGASAELRPGDAIVVPLDTTYSENLELWSRVTNIIYNSAVAFAAISNI